jgi:alpha-D-ribose 1-methylphosphonate 5-triphosphate diphosphatase
MLMTSPYTLSAKTIIHNVRIVTPDEVLPDASLVLEQGIISDITGKPTTVNGYDRIDGRGYLLLPGFVDIHSDVIENAIQPRPGGRFPVDVALHELDKQLVACGVTSIFHCLCFLDGKENPSFRNAEMTNYLIHQISSMKDEFRARTYVHARYEITNEKGFAQVEGLLKERLIHLFSLMDHTPGQGQFSEVAHFRAYYAKARGLSGERVDRIIEHRLEASRHIDWALITQLAQACRSNGVSIASHDDDCSEKVEAMHRMGVGLSEFPVNQEAARAARRHDMLISLGSPNILRGASLTGNLSGCEAIAAGLGDILCSDYAPMSLLHAALKLYRDDILDLPSAVRLITLNAARATGLDHLTGTIAPGKAADLVLVDDSRNVAQVARTFVSGHEVFSRGE